MKGTITAQIFTILVVFAMFGATYLHWHKQEMRAGRPAPLEAIYGTDEWTADYLGAEPRSRIEWIQEQLGEKVAARATTLEKIELVVGEILSEIQPHMGVPEEAGGGKTGLELYQGMLEGKASVWGDNLTRVYVAVANAVGIPTRLVEVGTEGRVAELPSHRFAESYLKEEGKWAFVDIDSRKAFVQDAQGQALDSVELFIALDEGRSDELEVALFQGGEMVRVAYDQHSALEEHRLAPGARLCYPRAQHVYGSRIRKLGYEILSPKMVYTLSGKIDQELAQSIDPGTGLEA